MPATGAPAPTNGVTTGASNAPSDQSTANRGLPYYEKLRRELRDTIQKKRLMDKSMVSRVARQVAPDRHCTQRTSHWKTTRRIEPGSHAAIDFAFELYISYILTVLRTGPTRGPDLPIRANLPRRNDGRQHHQGLRQLHQGLIKRLQSRCLRVKSRIRYWRAAQSTSDRFRPSFLTKLCKLHAGRSRKLSMKEKFPANNANSVSLDRIPPAHPPHKQPHLTPQHRPPQLGGTHLQIRALAATLRRHLKPVVAARPKIRRSQVVARRIPRARTRPMILQMMIPSHL